MPEKISNDLEQKIIELAKESMRLAPSYSLRDIRALLDVDVSIGTIARVLHKAGIEPKGKVRVSSHKETDK